VLTPTATPQIIDPNAGNNDSTPTVIVIVPNAITPTPGDPATFTPMPEAQVVVATPTVFVIQPTLPSPTPATLLLPTATPAGIITPAVQSQLVLPTLTPATIGTVDANNPNAIPTPTDLPLPTNSACVYVVKSGDNLFRIALSNNVTLAALLSANGLSENSIIQPGQTLRLPNCEGEASTAPASTATPASPSTDGGTVHRVVSGDTLFGIAQRYGVTVQQIIQANNLTNPDRLSVGQELIIPR
jgi:LysM repeat protein